MSALLIAMLCTLSWLLTARGLYHRWKEESGRPLSFLKCARRHEKYDSYHSCCIPDARGLADGGAAAVAMLAAVLFPAVWATALVRWQPGKLRVMRSTRGGVRVVRRTQVLAGKALELAERESLGD